jgi:hypothetical protein
LADDVRDLFKNAVEIRLIAPAKVDTGRPLRVGRDPSELFREYLSSAGVEDGRLHTLFDELIGEAQEVGT